MQVRVLSADDEGAVRLSLRRLGLDPGGIEKAGRRFAWASLFLSGASRAELGSLEAAASSQGLSFQPGHPERAAGTALLGGPREAIEGLCLKMGEGDPCASAIRLSLSRHFAPAPPMDLPGGRRLSFGERTLIIGVLNVTPDSFYDGGRYAAREAALRRASELIEEGADLLDLGGESTRPGASPVSAQEEMDRVLPLIEALRRAPVPLSIDTTKAKVAEAALACGAALVNDVSAFRHDSQMVEVIARHQAGAIAMHMRGEPRTMQEDPRYTDVVAEVIEVLQAAISSAVRAGVREERIFVDPGIGFGKTLGHNLFLLRNLRQLRALGRPIAVGPSRKSFLGKITGKPPEGRLFATVASVAQAVLAGADAVRVHDVAGARDAARVAEAIRAAKEGGLAYEGETPHGAR